MANNSKSRIVVAMSGGVDSSVSALLLKQQGYEVFGAHMINWDRQINETNMDGYCGSHSQDLEDAKAVAALLDIPLRIYNFSAEYWEKVFVPYINLFKKNFIGNPDVFCNSKIKFGELLNRIKEDFGEDIKIASGHYASVVKVSESYYLEVCKNRKKDQTYFLSRLNKEQLGKVIFPLSEFKSKSEIRKIAKINNFPNWNKKGSTGICFIGKRHFQPFIQKFIDDCCGKIIDIEENKFVGTHRGVHLYSLNQRKGVNISGASQKYYVCKKDLETSTLYVCKANSRDKYLKSSLCEIIDLHWINDPPKKGSKLFMKLKYTGFLISGKVEEIFEDKWLFSHESHFMPNPGQIAAFYSWDRSRCLGSGIYLTGII